MANQISVKLEHVDGLKFNVQLQDGRGIELNSPTEIGKSFAPMELFLVALAGCTAMDVQWIMEKERQKVRKLEVSARGIRRDEDPRYYETIDLEYVVAGANISKAAVERAIHLSQDKYCSIRAMLKETVKVNATYRIEERPAPGPKQLQASSPAPS